MESKYSINDDLDDNEYTHETFFYHLKLIQQFILNSINNWFDLPPTTSTSSISTAKFSSTPLSSSTGDQSTSSTTTTTTISIINLFPPLLKLSVMRMETFAFITTLLILIFLCHTFEFWFTFICNQIFKYWLNKKTTNMQNKNNKFNLSDKQLRNDDLNELKDYNVGIYAIQGRRPKMEDRFSYINQNESIGLEMFAIYDGHGGDTAAKFVKQKLFDTILERVNNYLLYGADEKNFLNESKQENKLDEEENEYHERNNEKDFEHCYHITKEKSEYEISGQILSKIIKDSILSVDDELLIKSKRVNDIAGTTALIAIRLYNTNQLVVANVGDSRGVLCDFEGNVVPISFDHKPQELKERERIKENGGFISFNGVWRVAGSLATSRALGDYPLKDMKYVIADPDILTFNLNEVQPQFMLLASDGLWDMMSNEEAVEYIKSNMEALQKRNLKSDEIAYTLAKNIANEAYKRGSFDNITVAVGLFDKQSMLKRCVPREDKRKSIFTLSNYNSKQ